MQWLKTIRRSLYVDKLGNAVYQSGWQVEDGLAPILTSDAAV